MRGDAAQAGRDLGSTPYRLAPAARPVGPSGRRAWALGSIALGLSVLAGSSLCRRPPSGVVRAVDGRHRRVLTDRASLLAGGAHLCAQARVAPGRFEVTCDPVSIVNLEGGPRAVSRAWITEELVQLRPPTGGHIAYLRYLWAERFEHPLPELIATGARRDGGWLAFMRDESKPRSIELPPTGAHGAILDLRYSVGRTPPGRCGNGWGWWHQWVARTTDGALLTPVWSPAGETWAEVVPPGVGVREFVTAGHHYCVIAQDRDVLCGNLRDLAAGPSPVAALRQPEPRDVAMSPGADLVCVRSRAGSVRCARLTSGTPVALRGPSSALVAVVLGPDDACVGEVGGTWWCARGPNDDAPMPRDPARSLALRPVPELAGAAEVALADEGGCARMRDGAVSCWGRAMRRRSVRAHAEATEIAGLRNATAVAAGSGLGCAIDDGRLRCWRFVPQGRVVRAQPPFDVPLGAPVRAVAVGEGLACAAGDAEVWCGRHDRDAPFSPVAIGLAGAGVTGAPRSLIAAGATIWLSNDRGAVWSIADHGRVPMDVSRVRRLDGGDRLARLGHLVCALRDGVVRRCGADSLDWSGDLVEGRRIPLANTEELEPSTTLLTRLGPGMRPWCRWDTGGRVACHDPGGADEPVAGLPPSREVSAGHPATACAIAVDGRVFCWGSLVSEALTDAEVDREPRMAPFRR